MSEDLSPQENDPIAEQTDWNSCANNSKSYCDTELCYSDSNRLEFRKKKGYSLFLFVIALTTITAGTLFVFIAPTLTGTKGSIIGYALVAAGLLQYPFALLIFYFGRKSIIQRQIFDKKTGYYWHGKKNPMRFNEPKQFSALVPLEKIYAIQVLFKEMTSSSSSSPSSAYSMCYECNLVLSDATRINVLNHADGEALQSDAETIAQFLEIPLWKTF